MFVVVVVARKVFDGEDGLFIPHLSHKPYVIGCRHLMAKYVLAALNKTLRC